MIPTIILCLLLFNDKNPNSRLPWVLADFRTELIFPCKMFAAAMIYSIDPGFNLSSIYLITFSIADVITLLIHIYSNSYLHFSIQIIDITGIVTTLIFSQNLQLEVVIVIYKGLI